MMTTNLMSAAVNNDAELVNGTLVGNRDSFGLIVSRYQSLICSLAYSATGSFGQSEDLAQETFITAWKHLGHLRERDKLRSWLCGIARNRINNFLRREGREPVRTAEPLDNVVETHAAEPLPAEQTISNEEQAILWRSLERIPEIYREPLILYYREHQSIESVAEDLDLTEDTVKQRLSRGRKMLQEQVLAFVEGALQRTNPDRSFTLAVLAALPAAMSTTAKATTLAAAAKGAGTMKAAGALGIFGMLLSPLMVLFGNLLPYRIGLAEARSEEERQHVKTFYRRVVSWGLILSIGLVVALWLALGDQVAGPVKPLDVFTAWFISFVIFYLLLIFGLATAGARKRRANLSAELANEHGGQFPPAAFEYCTRAKFLGLPLVHIRVGDRFDLVRGPVKGWIAMGNFAVGGLAAFGGVTVAPVCVGGVAVGLVAMGGFTLGFIVLGALAAGAFALGGAVAGWQAIGGFAIGWQSAVGNLALAHDFAVGNIVRAAQANTEAAKQFVNSGTFLPAASFINRHMFWMNLTWIVPLFIQWRLIARSRHERKNF
jgi:RNA polymerase sigma factor (sigma-70 family)